MEAVNNSPRRTLSTEEKLIESEYKAKKLSILIGILSAHLGNEKVLYLAKMGHYPKTPEEIQAIIDSKFVSKDQQELLKEIYDVLVAFKVEEEVSYMKKLKSIFE